MRSEDCRSAWLWLAETSTSPPDSWSGFPAVWCVLVHWLSPWGSLTCPFCLQALVSLHSHKDSLLPGAERLRNGDPESLSELPVARTLCQPSEVKIFLSHVAQISPLAGWLVSAAGRAEIRGAGGMSCLGVQ